MSIETQLQQYCTPEQWKQITAFCAFLQEKNQVVNLISRKESELIIPQHVAPCFVYKMLGRIQPREYILDIGSGGGFPGLINAILFPDTEFVLIDATQKKVRVLEEAIETLGLTNAEAVWSRVEAFAQQEEYQETFDRTTSRAVAPLVELVRWSQPLLRDGGTVEAMKGGNLTDELAAVQYPYAIHTLPTEMLWNEKLTSLKLVTVTL